MGMLSPGAIAEGSLRSCEQEKLNAMPTKDGCHLTVCSHQTRRGVTTPYRVNVQKRIRQLSSLEKLY